MWEPSPFARWLKEQMESRQLGIRKLALSSGVSRSSLSSLLRGETRQASLETLHKLASFFEVPTQELVQIATTDAPQEEKCELPAYSDLQATLRELAYVLTPAEMEELRVSLKFLLARKRRRLESVAQQSQIQSNAAS